MEFDIIFWDNEYNIRLLVNLTVVIVLFTSLRFFSGAIAHINASEELLKKDNPAFGLSLAGTTLAVTWMLSGTVYGDPEITVMDGALLIAFHGLLGLFFMALTRIIFDKIALRNVSLRDEIVKGNMAVAIADTSNVLAAAIIIRAVMIWFPYTDISSLLTLAGCYAISQIMLTGATIARTQIFKYRHKGFTADEELQKGNVAYALTFGGRIIATALAIVMASELVSYEDTGFQAMLMGWILMSVVVAVVLKILSVISEKIIMYNVDFSHELLTQKNIAVGAVRAIIYISMGILLAEL
ncbi:MAG: DUF350 domain-containing protein [Rhodospirillales bacterium]|nr:DUF350 domain-containing protein [Alphaproteobacteria bacterium]MCB9976862.1 DUF350 domain-containing protein [Rhodospirillales bacterium]